MKLNFLCAMPYWFRPSFHPSFPSFFQEAAPTGDGLLRRRRRRRRQGLLVRRAVQHAARVAPELAAAEGRGHAPEVRHQGQGEGGRAQGGGERGGWDWNSLDSGLIFLTFCIRLGLFIKSYKINSQCLIL